MPGPSIRPVADDAWGVLAWLWQLFRPDLAVVVGGLPYADGRYQARSLDAYRAESKPLKIAVLTPDVTSRRPRAAVPAWKR